MSNDTSPNSPAAWTTPGDCVTRIGRGFGGDGKHARRIARVYLSTTGHVIVPSRSGPLADHPGDPTHLTQ
jgi:hypothetical protein